MPKSPKKCDDVSCFCSQYCSLVLIYFLCNICVSTDFPLTGFLSVAGRDKEMVPPFRAMESLHRFVHESCLVFCFPYTDFFFFLYLTNLWD